MKLKNKHTAADVTIFTEMSALALKNNAINLSQGFPDDEIDEKLKKLLAKATNENFNQYAPMSGNTLLINNLIEFNSKRDFPIQITPKEMVITPGATYGIYTAISAAIEPGDEVIIIEPAYDSYQPSVEMNGGVPVFVSMKEHFNVDWNELKSKISEKTKAIIVNSPQNPTGKVWTREEWNQLWEIIKDTEIFVISDEVYDLIHFDDTEFYSALHHPEIRKRCFAVFSFGKMFHITGWKIGYVVACEELMQAFKRIHQYITFCVNAPGQQALAEYLEVFDVKKNREMMQQKRDFFLSEIRDLPFTVTDVSKGSYFQVVGYEKISDKGDKDFAVWLTENYKVATIPLSAFYHDRKDIKQIRFCFSKKEETILNAVRNLQNLH